MKITVITISSIIIILLSLFVAMKLLTVSVKHDYHYFYFVQKWPGTVHGDEEQSSSNPFTTPQVTVAEFRIHGLWPHNDQNFILRNCDRHLKEKDKSSYDASLIEDLIPSLQRHWPALTSQRGDDAKTWEHQWEKHGTCSKYTLNQHAYFKAGLDLQAKRSLLQILADEEIIPDGSFYDLRKIRKVLTNGIGSVPGLECTVDKSGDINLYQVGICVDKSGSSFIDCPLYPLVKNCGSKNIKFPSFGARHLKDAVESPNELAQ